GRLIPRLCRAVKLRVGPRLRPAQMQQQEKRAQGGFAVLAPKAQDRATRPCIVVIDLADLGLLPVPQLHRLADIAAFRNAAIALDPRGVSLAARQLLTCQIPTPSTA